MIDSTIKNRAIELRKQAKSYSEILKEIPVAKSTLSEWFVNVGLSKRQKQMLTERRKAAQARGWAARRSKRLRIQSEIINSAKKEIGSISNRELLLIGTSLYWAEGSKEKEYRPGSRLQFSNSDWMMVKAFMVFLIKILGVKIDDIDLDLYVHENRRDDVEKMRVFWSNRLALPLEKLSRVYFKKGNPKTIRYNSGATYVGLVRLTVKQSSALLRKVAGWTKGICENWGIV